MTTEVRRWPGMRSEYSLIPPGDSPGETAPYQIGVSFSGHDAAVYEVGGRTRSADIAPGAVFVTGGEPITWMRIAETTEALEIFPDPALLDTDEIREAQATRDGTVLAISSILRRAHTTSDLSDIAASTLAHRLAEHLQTEYAGTRTGPARGLLDRRTVDRVADYVEAELHDELTLDQLAAIATLSPFHFARSFKATTGLAPHQYVIARRMDRAKSLLLGTASAVPEVAAAVGLSNLTHFRRMFRRHLGLNPGELRRFARDSAR